MPPSNRHHHHTYNWQDKRKRAAAAAAVQQYLSEKGYYFCAVQSFQLMMVAQLWTLDYIVPETAVEQCNAFLHQMLPGWFWHSFCKFFRKLQEVYETKAV